MGQTVKIGLFGIGLEAYWPQFPELREKLVGYQAEIARHIGEADCELVDCGLVDTEFKAREAALKFKTEDVSLIFVFISTYALSSTVLPVVQKAKVPIVILNLQPVRAIDYKAFNALGDRTKMTGEWLGHCQACSVPEVSNAFRRAGLQFYQVTGTLHDDPIAWGHIMNWIEAARVALAMSDNRLGLMGHYYNGMLDIYSDPTTQAAAFGCHIEHVEMCELQGLRERVSDAEVEAKLGQIREHFDVQPDCREEDLAEAAKTSVALDKLVEAHQLGSLAYYYMGTPDPAYEHLISTVIVGNSLLTANGVPVAGEYEVKNAQAMKIMDCLGAGGSFTEFYAMDFDDDIVLMGHDGPGHIAIAEGKTKIKPLEVYHGKVGKGLSVEMSVKHGPVTLLSVVDEPGGGLKLLCAEGDSVPGPILEIGNTNSRYRFPIGVRAFMDAWCAEGPAHHCAVGVGHQADKIRKLGQILGMPVVRVC